MLTLYAQKLLAWFGIYKITATQYDAYLPAKAQRRGIFVDALDELVSLGY